MPKYQLSDKSFVNPYHFVPLESAGCARRSFYAMEHGEYEDMYDDRYTGWIDCELETLTPLFIPNSSNDNFFNLHDSKKRDKNEKALVKSYDFFSYHDLQDKTPASFFEPVVPGSTIRGVIRSAFETVTNGCMSTIDHNHILFKRFTIPYPHAGRIENSGNGWRLQPCDMHGQEQPDPCYRCEGEVGITGTRSLRYFTPSDKEFIPLQPDDLMRLVQLIETYRDDRINQKLGDKPRDHHGYRDRFDLHNLNGGLVYYEVKRDRLYLSPAQIGKEVFHRRLTDMIDTYRPCNLLDALCPACMLFGLAGENEALASRVRFSDAHLVGLGNVAPNTLYCPHGVLPELASPKPSATEFYLKKQDSRHHLWNYDYAGFWRRGRESKEFVLDESYRPEIMGRKFYWHHHGLAAPPYIDEREATERHVCVRPVKPGVTFAFRVYFNRTFLTEMGALIWTLTHGFSQEHGHKMGMGKPVGLGSVKIRMKSLNVRRMSLKRTLHYSVEDETELGQAVALEAFLGCAPETLDAYKTVTKLNPGIANIRYPQNDDEGRFGEVNPDAAFLWFSANKQVAQGSSMINPILHQSLPAPVNETQPHLKKYKRISKR